MPLTNFIATAALFFLAPTTTVAAATPASEIEIIVEGGYKPARVEAPAGKPIRLKLIRREYTGCTREIVFPSVASVHLYIFDPARGR